MKKQPDLSEMAKKWPSALVARSEVGRFSGGLLNPRYLANIDSDQSVIGPKRFRIGRKIAYKATDLIAWMEARARTVD